jgi:hypothetical protein
VVRRRASDASVIIGKLATVGQVEELMIVL